MKRTRKKRQRQKRSGAGARQVRIVAAPAPSSWHDLDKRLKLLTGHLLQDEGGHAWTYSQGEIAALLNSGQPLPQDIQQVIEARCSCCPSTVGYSLLPVARGLPLLSYIEASSCGHCLCRRLAQELHLCMKRGDERAAVQIIDAVRKAAYIRHEQAQSYPIHDAISLVGSFHILTALVCDNYWPCRLLSWHDRAAGPVLINFLTVLRNCQNRTCCKSSPGLHCFPAPCSSATAAAALHWRLRGDCVDGTLLTSCCGQAPMMLLCCGPCRPAAAPPP